ncbi:MAG: ribonuclease P protein subunit [Nitrososphaerota archaeon]|nr:ribonuclease P protein subunit [Nitrososphaerota archaeon]MDG6926884.1 ribonuclease P protein subunit [Nitrososphaerota archaeon]MDG6929998.1 ribonuclease P protein subunit [Nitrososphaerota archaeon]MDG6931949.1 ribonuclease P protein subunit [Nitrososphaerota archaeon]MDG6943848.1 ribonuclease P protein subunit [Nitrososphaerota archaeon]
MIKLGDSIKVKNTDVEGMLVYETKNTFWINSGHISIVPKAGNLFEVNGRLYNGSSIAKRAWERLDP